MRDAHGRGEIGAKARDHRQMEERAGGDKKPKPSRKLVKVSAVAIDHPGRDSQYDEVEPADKNNVERGDAINGPACHDREPEENAMIPARRSFARKDRPRKGKRLPT